MNLGRLCLYAVLPAFFLPGELSSATAWRAEGQVRGVAISSRVRPGSTLKEFRGIGLIKAAPAVVHAVIEDREKYPSFMPYTAESRIVKRRGSVLFNYQRLALPMMKDRDYTVRVRRSRERSPAGPVFFIRWEAADETGPPPRPGITRVHLCEGSWRLEPVSEGVTRATYTIYTDTGGAVPAFVANFGGRIGIGKLFEAVRRRALDPTLHQLIPTLTFFPMSFRLIPLATSLLIFSSFTVEGRKPEPVSRIAEGYAQLVLALGQHDADYVDAFYGPAAWKEEAAREKKPLAAIATSAARFVEELAQLPTPTPEIERLRREYLQKQLGALQARLRLMQGAKMSFDEESRALYDAVAPSLPEAHFEEVLEQLATKLPGKGPLWERYQEWRRPFIIPREKLDGVFQLALTEARDRTRRQLDLPEGEAFTIEYVTDKPWSGYNWYQGGYRSVIQINTDLPVYIDRAMDLAAHEGYPGHHVYNALLEKNLVRDRGWVEFMVYPLFSPQSLIAEGTANFGKEIIFTPSERLAFEREVLFPAAGIDPTRAAEYYEVLALVKKLAYARNEAARAYLEGKMDRAQAQRFLERFALMDPARAEQSLKFIDRYRSYVINYNLGEDLVRAYVEKRAGKEPGKRWKIFGDLLASPRLPGSLE